MVVSLDSALLLAALTALLLGDFAPFDVLLLALHLPHLFTTAIAYVSVHYSTAAADVLRMLIVFYLLALTIDIFVAIARCAFLIHARDRHFLAELVRLFLACAFAATDIAGAIFTDFARTSFHTFALLTNHQLVTFAHRAAPPPLSTLPV